MSKPTFSSALAMGLCSVACAAACGLLTVRGAPHIAAVCLLGWLAFGIASLCEFCGAWKRRQRAWKRRQRRHAPFIRPARPTDTP